jgi:drug/metabolite transporter (DMT)-like permease
MAATTLAPARLVPRAVGTRAYLGLGLATLGWASGFVLGKVALREMTPLAVGAWRYVVATVLLLPLIARGRRRGHTRLADVRGAALPLGVMVCFGGILYPWLFLAALARTSATNTSLLIALNPVLTLLLTPLVGERLARLRLYGAALAFGGAILVIGRGDLAALLALRVDAGDLLALGAAACWATFNLASRSVVERIPASTANFAVYAGGAAALCLLGASEHPGAQLSHASGAAIAALAGMALLSSVIAGQLFLIGVRAAGVGRAVIFIYLVPVLTALSSAVVLGESLSAAQLVGGSAVLVGLVVATRDGA